MVPRGHEDRDGPDRTQASAVTVMEMITAVEPMLTPPRSNMEERSRNLSRD